MTGNAMNSTSQFDLHPDADSLNAFAEQALAARDREQLLAHLAGCSRCRQVIFLAQQAATEAEAPARVSSTPHAIQPSTWFWNWRFAWVPVAALAAVLALLVTFHPWHTTSAPEMARVTPPRDEAVPAPLPQERAGTGAAHKPALTANSAAGNSNIAEPRRPYHLLSAPSAAPPADFGAIAPSTEEKTSALPTSMDAAQQQVSAAQFQPEPAVTAWQQEQQRSAGMLSASANATQVSQKSMRMEAYNVHTSRQTASAGPRMAQQSQAAPSSSFNIGTQEQLAGMTASRKGNPPMLPSGLPVVSRATAQHLVLEIDRAGTLFLSDETGEYWEPVARQWTGRAIEVRAKTGSSGGTAPATGFELKNDAGSTWASADGKTWTAQ
jgi:hypothetical protein